MNWYYIRSSHAWLALYDYIPDCLDKMAKCNTCMSKLTQEQEDECNKCINDTLRREAPLLNKPLMYADFHRKGATKNIVKFLCSFYSDELKSAKSLLYKQFRYFNILQNDAEDGLLKIGPI